MSHIQIIIDAEDGGYVSTGRKTDILIPSEIKFLNWNVEADYAFHNKEDRGFFKLTAKKGKYTGENVDFLEDFSEIFSSSKNELSIHSKNHFFRCNDVLRIIIENCENVKKINLKFNYIDEEKK